jgi:prolyl-tRNA editing enzyme YbaK/EbsC (Cys-tRNA(Pro) deacylase)
LVASKKEPKKYAACVLQASRLLDVNHKVRELMGVSRVSFANAEETARVTGMLVGGVTVFALPEGIPIYVDEPVMALDYAILGGGGRSSKIKLRPAELLRVPGLQVVAGLAAERQRRGSTEGS